VRNSWVTTPGGVIGTVGAAIGLSVAERNQKEKGTRYDTAGSSRPPEVADSSNHLSVFICVLCVHLRLTLFGPQMNAGKFMQICGVRVTENVVG
jgi:hypothetical protein